MSHRKDIPVEEFVIKINPPDTERLHLRISPQLKQKLQVAAEAEGRTVSNYVKQLIKAALDQTE